MRMLKFGYVQQLFAKFSKNSKPGHHECEKQQLTIYILLNVYQTNKLNHGNFVVAWR